MVVSYIHCFLTSRSQSLSVSVSLSTKRPPPPPKKSLNKNAYHTHTHTHTCRHVCIHTRNISNVLIPHNGQICWFHVIRCGFHRISCQFCEIGAFWKALMHICGKSLPILWNRGIGSHLPIPWNQQSCCLLCKNWQFRDFGTTYIYIYIKKYIYICVCV